MGKDGQRLRLHLARIDADVEPVVERYRAHVQCAAGCSDCCHQTFRISEIDGQGRALSPAERTDMFRERLTWPTKTS